MVDYATSLHIMAPIFVREDAEIINGVFRDFWVNWAGPPTTLELDPSKPNLSDSLAEFREGMGVDLQYIAAGSQRQLGKVERHGSWFEEIFKRESM